MTNKIDELNARYLIPGIELGTTAVADPDGTEEDYGDAPYSQVPAVTDIPSPIWLAGSARSKSGFTKSQPDRPSASASFAGERGKRKYWRCFFTFSGKRFRWRYGRGSHLA